MIRSRKFSCGQQKGKDNDDREANASRNTENIASSDVGWVGPITMRRRAKPELENVRYRDISLRISVQEVKNLSFKGRYFCELCLDRTLYARTTSKQSNGTVFWGEKFTLNNLPEISIITINLYRHGSGSAKEKRQRYKEQNQFVAFVTIPLADLPSTGDRQQWLTMQPTTVNPNLLQSSVSDRWGHASQTRDSEPRNVGSPSGVRFRKRSMPVTCFRHSTSTAAFGALSGLVRSPDTSVSANGSRKKRSWTSGVTGVLENSSSRGVPSSIRDSPESTGISPNCDSARLSFSLPECSPPQIRISVQYESIDILPLNYYVELRELLRTHSSLLVRTLEPILSTKQKEELASCLVNIHEKLPHFNVATFLAELLEEDIKQNADGAMLLRSNSTASKAVECYIKLVGSEYLQRVLKSFIDQLLVSPEDFEIDPSRLKALDSSTPSSKSDPSSQMEKNYFALLKYLTAIWRRIVETSGSLPTELREVFHTLRDLLEHTHERDVAVRVISSCLFLRFICPAIHGPVLFGLTDRVPESCRVSRNLTLVAKVLQNLANLTTFEDKEPHMKVLNSFVVKEIPIMRTFLEDISSVPELTINGDLRNDCHNYIDLGYEFAKISSLFCEYIPKVELPSELAQLPNIVSFVVEHSTDAVLSPWVQDVVPYQDSFANGQLSTQTFRHNSSDDECTSCRNGIHSFVCRSAPSVSSKSSVTANKNYDTNILCTKPSCVDPGLLSLASTFCVTDEPSLGHIHNNVGPQEPGTSVEAMDDLFVQYREQLRQLNACIDQVENISLTSESDRHGQSGRFFDAIIEADSLASTPRCDRVYDHLVTQDNVVKRGEDFASHRFMDNETCNHLNGSDDGICRSNSVDIQNDEVFINGSFTGQSMLSQSPSLDQLAERLQELKRLLKSEREELAQVVAAKTQVIRAQEQSIQQLTCEIDQLRRMPNTANRLFSGSSTNRYTPGTVSPSSSFSSECFPSNQSEDFFTPTASSGVAQITRQLDEIHNISTHKTMDSCEQLKHNAIRSQSFLYKLRSNGPETMGAKQAANLMDLSLASVGTGIPLGELIVAKHPVPFRRRFSETKIIPN